MALGLVCSVACGGHARSDALGDVPASSAGIGGADGVAGAAGVGGVGGGAGAVAGSGAGRAVMDSELGDGCLQALSGRSCPRLEIDISFESDVVGPRAGMWVEPLQIPEYSEVLAMSLPEIEPSKWDRSALPAGACVLRIHGLSGACLQPGGLFVGTCASLADPGTSHVLPYSYYELDACRQGIAPGCPSAAAADWNNGSWWYLVARGEDTDLVVCAPECGGAYLPGKHGCLRMAGSN